MPTNNEILEGLRYITNNYKLISIYWHIVIYIAMIIILLSLLRPTYRMIGMLLALPFVTVALLAWDSGNPFTGILFTLLVLLWVIYGFKLSQDHTQYSTLWFRIAGFLLLLFGLWYPHFLTNGSVMEYLYAAPTGLIPCPTLSLSIGTALIFNAFNSKPLRIILLCYGFFYSLFGILKLGVYLDILLLAGTIVLLLQYLHDRRS